VAQFDWDDANRNHLRRHRVSPDEFEQAMSNDPLDLEWEGVDDEIRYHTIGTTDSSRVLYMVWTPRDGAIRAVTAFTASRAAKQAWLRRKV
jgi:uncharacterized DUF497 family protein